MTTITFDSVTLRNPAPLKPTQTADSFEITIECYTEDHTDIENLIAKAGKATKTLLLSGKTAIQTTGTKGSLVIGSDTYTNCVIMDGVKEEEQAGSANTRWTYRATFARETKT